MIKCLKSIFNKILGHKSLNNPIVIEENVNYWCVVDKNEPIDPNTIIRYIDKGERIDRTEVFAPNTRVRYIVRLT